MCNLSMDIVERRYREGYLRGYEKGYRDGFRIGVVFFLEIL